MRSRTIIATPSGATIKEQLDDREMTQKEFALRMDMSEKHVSQLINGEVRLTPAVALRLESVLGVPASYWNNLETRYRKSFFKWKKKMQWTATLHFQNCFRIQKWFNTTGLKKPQNPLIKYGIFAAILKSPVWESLII